MLLSKDETLGQLTKKVMKLLKVTPHDMLETDGA